ncbi:MAG: glycosyltransferase family 2 protein [Clostridia bacterium]
MSGKYLVSIIITTFRREREFREAVKSALRQNYDNIEVIVVDDNADKIWNDKVADIINEVCSNKIIYIKNIANMGSAKSRNKGVNLAKGDYITFLDDDDLYFEEKIKTQIESMLLIDADYSITDLYLYTENNNLIEKRCRNYIKDYSTKMLQRYHMMYHLTGTDTLMFKTDYIKKIGGFGNIDVGDEFYLMHNAIIAGGKFNYLPQCHVKAYVHTQNAGISIGGSKIKGEKQLYEYKKKFFKEFDTKTIKHIKMRHHAVLAFAFIRKREYIRFIIEAFKSFISAPLICIKFLAETILN